MKEFLLYAEKIAVRIICCISMTLLLLVLLFMNSLDCEAEEYRVMCG